MNTRILIIMLFFVTMTQVFAQDIESELDNELLNDNPSSKVISEDDNSAKWDVFGYVESENYFGITGKSKQGSKEIVKLESRANANLRYGTDFFYAKSNLDIYFYPKFAPETSNPNHQMPFPNGVIQARELYVAAGESLQLKLGKQLFNWGEADAFTVTNYPDQSDLRELLATGKDDSYQGVMSVSLKYIFSDFSVEGAFIPLHTPVLYPSKNSFWDLTSPQAKIALPPMTGTPFANGYSQNVTPQISYGEALGGSYQNMSAAIRAGGTINSLDFHFSYFNGIDKNILFLPTTTIENAKFATQDAYSIKAAPFYKRVQSFGFDFAYDIEKLTVRGEASFSPQKWAILKNQEQVAKAALSESLTKLGAGDNSPVSFSAPIEKTQHLAYVIGADYLLWGEDGRILVEWMQTSYLKNPERYQADFFTQILLIRIEDKLFDKRLQLSLSTMLRPTQKKPGFISTPEIAWNFQNGFTLTAGAMFFTGYGDELIMQFDDNDFAYLAGRMEY